MRNGTNKETALKLERIDKSYGSVQALKELSLEIPKGQLCSFLGRNGAGKTTAIRILLGLTGADKGEATLFGEKPGSMAARERTGAMLQKTELPEQLRVGELIDIFSAAYPTPMARNTLLDLTGLDPLLDRPYGKLSGGQQRLTQFAVALCGNPDLLLLDEPSTGLDADVRTSLWSGIRALLESGKTILLTTHYLQEAEALSDRVIVLDHGRLVADDTPEAIKRHAGGKCISCRTTLPNEQLQSFAGVSKISLKGALTQLHTSEVETCLRQLLAADLGVSDLTVSETALEDAFLALTNTAKNTKLGEAA